MVMHGFPWANQSQFEAPKGEVKWSRAVLGHGQAVKALIWAVKDLDHGQNCIN